MCKENYWDHQCEFRRNGSTTDHVFCIHPILEKKGEVTEAVHQLLTAFKKVNDSVLFNILIEYGIPMNILTPIKMCMSETSSRVQVEKHLSKFPVKNGSKHGDSL